MHKLIALYKLYKMNHGFYPWLSLFSFENSGKLKSSSAVYFVGQGIVTNSRCVCFFNDCIKDEI